MSKAGVESSRGDAYQTLVGVKWAVGMLLNPSLIRMEVDATSLDAADMQNVPGTAHIPGESYAVDDVVIHGTDGSLTCCQCKKNSPNGKAWTVAALADDLRKAWTQHRRTPGADIRFYSRSPFGGLACLTERSCIMPDAAAFMHDMPSGLDKEYAVLAELSARPGEDRATDAEVYALLRRLSFETSSDEILRDYALNILRQGMVRADHAFDAIRQMVDDTARRQPDSRRNSVPRANHEITRECLIRMLEERGHLLTPLKSETELADFFHKYSSRGRYWPRDIRGRRLVRRELAELMRLVDEGQRLVLVEGEPGGGKTCLLLDALDAVDRDPAREAVFLQTRDFASADFAELEGVFLGNLARLAEIRPVVLLVDSLDVLSVARERRALSVFLAVLSRAARLTGVTTVAACRSFDVRYDKRLSAIAWDGRVTLGGLDFETEVAPLLAAEGADPAGVVGSQKLLLGNPRMLSMYMDILGAGGRILAITPQELAEQYVRTVVADDPDLGNEACATLRSMARDMVERRCLSLPESRVGLGAGLARSLLSAGVLVRTDQGYAFAHQTLVDVLAVMAAEADGLSLANFMRRLKPVPFVRPSVRAFFFHLRAHTPDRFVRETRAALAAEDLAFHLKRLLAASLAEIEPTDADRSLLRHLFQHHSTLFSVFFEAADAARWEPFFQAHLLPLWRETGNGPWLVRHAAKMSRVDGLPSDAFADLWIEVLDREDGGADAAWHATSALEKRARWTEPRLEEVFLRVVRKLNMPVFYLLGKPLSLWVAATDAHDDLLWEYVTWGVDKTKDHYAGNQKPLCRAHDFCTETFFAERMEASEILLSLAVAFVEEWSRTIDETRGFEYSGGHFLTATSCREMGHALDPHEGMSVLLVSMERACARHAKDDTMWWRTHRDTLLRSPERALQYMGILGCLARPETNIRAIETLLRAVGETHGYPFEYELRHLVRAVAFFLDETSLREITCILLHLYEDGDEEDVETPVFVLASRREWLLFLPAPLRSREAQIFLARMERRYGPAFPTPAPSVEPLPVKAPVSCDRLIRMSDQALLRLLTYYQGYEGWDEGIASLLGGAREVAWELRKAAELDPQRFCGWLKSKRQVVDILFRRAILSGIGQHVCYRSGRSRPDTDWAPRSLPDVSILLRDMLDMMKEEPPGRIAEDLPEVFAACAQVARRKEDVERTAFFLVSCLAAAEPTPDREHNDLLSLGINSARGRAADAAMTLAIRRLEQTTEPVPDRVITLLGCFARDPHPAVRAVVLWRLPFLLPKAPDIGWNLLNSCLESGTKTLWQYAYNCLYYQYYNQFDRVVAYLERMKKEGMPEAGGTWGKILALAFLSDKISLDSFIADLHEMDVDSAWAGAADVFTTNVFNDSVYAACLQGLEAIFSWSKPSEKIHASLAHLFMSREGKVRCFSREFLACFLTYETKIKEIHYIVSELWEWVLGVSDTNIECAVTVAEMLVRFIRDQTEFLLLEREIPTLLTRFFREAEDSEEVDDGALLKRVIALQDELLVLGASGVEEWLAAAERP